MACQVTRSSSSLDARTALLSSSGQDVGFSLRQPGFDSRQEHHVERRFRDGVSSNGRTTVSEAVYGGSNPSSPTRLAVQIYPALKGPYEKHHRELLGHVRVFRESSNGQDSGL